MYEIRAPWMWTPEVGLSANCRIHVGEDGRIHEANDSDDSDARHVAEVLSFEGMTVLPGLVDMHAHFLTRGPGDSQLRLPDQGATARAARAVWSLAETLRTGVTTVRDAGAWSSGIFALRDMLADSTIVGPSMVAAGQAIAMTGGHGCESIAREADGPSGLLVAAREQLKYGADCIKVMMSGGAGSPREGITDEQLGLDEVTPAVREAHKRGKHVLAHATDSLAVRAAVAAGVDSIEHGLLLDERAVADMVQAGTYLCPTLQSYELLVENREMFPAFMVAKAEGVVEEHRESLRRAASAGVRLLVGTDADPHYRVGDIADEMSRMVDSGLSHRAVLEAATVNAATCLGCVGDLGTLMPGAWADILIVRGNPLQDIRALSDVAGVFRRGVRIR